VAIVLIFAPLIFGFQSVGGAAVIIPMVLGIVLFLYSLLTDYEWGVIRVLAMPYHLVIDLIAAVFLLISPFIFGFSDESLNAWLPHVVAGAAVILVVIFSQTQSRKPELKSM
jgi:hypothetical protein